MKFYCTSHEDNTMGTLNPDTELFKLKVTDVVKTYLDELRMKTLVSEAQREVMRYMKEHIPEQVQDKVKSYLHDNLSDKVSAAIAGQHSMIVEKATSILLREAQSFIQNNMTIQSMLSSHHLSIQEMLNNCVDSCKNKVHEAIRVELDKIVREQQYQTLNDALIRSLDERMCKSVDIAVTNVQERVKAELDHLHKMEENIKNATTLYGQLSTRVHSQETNHSTLASVANSRYTGLVWWNIALTVGLFGAFLWTLNK